MTGICVLFGISHMLAKGIQSLIFHAGLSVFAHTCGGVLDVFGALGHELLICSLYLQSSWFCVCILTASAFV